MKRHLITLIPARAGSKGIPGKNTKICAGKPLIQYTFDSVRMAQLPGRVFVSSDCDEVNRLALANGIEVPFVRPESLSGDDSKITEVIVHFLEWVKANNIPCDSLMLLQPTSPLRKPESLIGSVEKFYEKDVDSLVSMVRVPHAFVPSSLMKLDESGFITGLDGGSIVPGVRQKKEILFARNGPSILISKIGVLTTGMLYGKKTIGFEMTPEESIDIDDPFEFKVAECLLKCGEKN